MKGGRREVRRYWGERIAATVYILISLYVGWLALDFPAGGGTFPVFAAGSAVILSLIMIATSFVVKSRERSARVDFHLNFRKLMPVLISGLVAVYILAIFELGYFTSTLLFFVIASLLVGIRNYRAIVITLAVLLPSMYVFFVVLLKAQLPEGILV